MYILVVYNSNDVAWLEKKNFFENPPIRVGLKSEICLIYKNSSYNMKVHIISTIFS